MNRIVLSVWLLASVTACNDSTQPSEPVISPPAAAVAQAKQQFTVRSLGTLGGTFSGANSINERGEVAGFSELPSGEVRAILWSPGHGMKSLGVLGGAVSRARGLNDRSEVVGFSQIHPGSDETRAFLWTQSAGMRSLGTLGGPNSQANAINNRREVVGSSDTRNGNFRAFLWRPAGGIRNLGTLGGKNSQAFGVNDATQVVGGAETAGGDEHAFRWTSARGMQDLGTLGGATSRSLGISQTGEVVGMSETATGKEVAFLWTPEHGMRSLGSLNHDPVAFGTSINTHRRAVGASFADEVLDLPFVWIGGRGLLRLPDLGGGRGRAESLNEFGQIVGTTWNKQNGIRATLWTPSVARSSRQEPVRARRKRFAAMIST